MPPEPLPWERFKERRYDRPPPDVVGPGPRWRDPPPHNGFRGRLPGNGRPGPWRYHSAESGRGFAPSRATDKFIGDEGFRPSGYRLDARHNNNRFNRENNNSNKGPFGHRDMRGHSWENDISPNSSGRPYFGNDQRSIDKNHCWENGRLQNGSDQRSFDEKGPFGRRENRGKFWENGKNMGNVQNSADDTETPFEKKVLKRRSPENGDLKRPHLSNDQRPVDDKGSSAQKDLKGKYCENIEKVQTGGDPSSVEDKEIKEDKDIKDHFMENNVVVPNSDQIPPDNMLTFTSPTHSEHSKDQYDKFKKIENDNSIVSIDWKPLKWSRSGSLSSRGSGFSHSSCMKSPEYTELKTEMPHNNNNNNIIIATPLRSPSGDTGGGGAAFSAVSSEEASGSRKKARLGWGEGLAKFEKKKVEGPDDDSATKPGLVVSVSGEISQVSNNADNKSPGFLECVSPVTPSSVARSFSPGVEDKACSQSANLDYDTNYPNVSPNPPLEEHTEGNQEKEFILENVENISVANISSSLTELIHLEDPATVESNFVRSTSMNKLLLWRGEALKALEATESEIDSLENDLKKLIPEPVSNCPRPTISGSLKGDSQEKTSENVALSVLSPTLKIAEPKGADKKSCENMDVEIVENLEICPIYENVEGLSISEGSENAEALCDRILASNKDTAIKAYEIFSKVLPSNLSIIHDSGPRSVSSWKDNPRIMEKFAFKKHSRKFQERVNILKYRALQHLWKEDLQLMSLKKNNSKSHKKLDLSSRGSIGSSKKHRSFRSRISNAAGTSSLVPTAGAINFTSKLLSDSQIKPYRNSLKMPALIMDKKEKIASIFISNNGLVEDPCAQEKERTMINPWTKEEKDIFMDKFASFGKDFNKISSFLDHKTTADCVEFYYKNHKSDFFTKTKKKPDFAKQGKSYSFNNYLVGSSNRWSRETNAASLDVLGEASEIAAKAIKIREKNNIRKSPKIDGPVKRSYDFDTSVNERETEAADVLAGICGSISSEAMGSCITSSFDRGGERERGEREALNTDIEESCSDDSCGELEPSEWTDQEKSIFIQAVSSYGNDFAMISRHVGTRSRDECSMYFSKGKKRFGLDTIRSGACSERKDENNNNNNNNNNGGGSDDLEGACVMEADSAVSSEKSSSKADKDVILSDVEINDLGKNEFKDSDESGKMIIDDIIEENKPEVDLELNTENGGDNDPTVVPELATTLSPLDEVEVTDPKQDSVEQEMVSENNSNGEENEKNLNNNHEATESGLRDLNTVQELDTSDNASNIADIGDNNIKQKEKIPIDLNPPLESLDNSLEDNIPSSAKDDFEILKEKLYIKSTSTNTCSKSYSTPPVFVGYPLQVSVNRDTNGDYNNSEIYPSSTPSTTSSGIEFPISEQKKFHLRHHSWSSSSDTEKPKSNGDVKLFGQILKSQPKESTSDNINQKITDTNILDSVVGKFDCNNYLGLENVPSRNFGFWDGNRGFPSIPDSAILLAKYPAAFSNLSGTSNIEHQQAVKGKNSDINLNGVSVFPNREMMTSGNGLVNYQVYMNQQDFISEMQRQNGIGAFSNIRNTNVGISDPVAAIKMHYAKVEKYGSGVTANNAVVEGESWREKADLGR